MEARLAAFILAGATVGKTSFIVAVVLGLSGLIALFGSHLAKADVTLDYRCMGDVTFSFEGVTGEQARLFEEDFCGSIEDVNRWWGEPYTGEYRVEVFKSDGPEPSMALVPAWRGNRGKMLFCSWRVARRQAAIVHEQTHVVAPNQNRFLAEGLAVYLQMSLRPKSRVFPNFGTPLDEAVKPYLGRVSLAQLDAIATPYRLQVDEAATEGEMTQSQNGENAGKDQGRALGVAATEVTDTIDAKGAYIMAGSFVTYLIDHHGMNKFRALYALTRLRECDYGHGCCRERWETVYGVGLDILEREWEDILRRMRVMN